MAAKGRYASVELPPRRRAAVARIAKKEGRGLAKQAGILIELGLAEYERRVRGGDAIRAALDREEAEKAAAEGRR